MEEDQVTGHKQDQHQGQENTTGTAASGNRGMLTHTQLIGTSCVLFIHSLWVAGAEITGNQT